MRYARRLLGFTLLTLAATAGADAARAAELELVNTSLKAIHHLYIAPTGTQRWGRDLLLGNTANTIPPGERRTIVNLAPAIYDLRLIDDDGDDYEIEAIEVETTIKVQLTESQIVDASPLR
jgi:hypothetical protein